MKHIAITQAHGVTFSWNVNSGLHEVALVIVAPPEYQENAHHDLLQMVEMMQVAGLDPQMLMSHVRLSKNGVPSVSLSWVGTINDVSAAEVLLGRMTELWGGSISTDPVKSITHIVIDQEELS